MSKARTIIPLAIMALAAVAVIPFTASGSGPRANAAACVPVTNIEAIIDDSGSMGGTDYNRLRKSAMDLLITKPGNANKTLGAVEFGTTATSLFTPMPIGPNIATMQSTLDTRTQADDGVTNYNDAFTLAKTENPGAGARIFLTDGGHNVDAYANGHTPGPPTYVIGFGTVTTAGTDGARLQQIATDTGGKYYAQADSSSLQSVVNEIDSIFNCARPPVAFTDNFTAAGQKKPHKRKLRRGTKRIEFVVSWGDPNSAFDIVGVQIVKNGRVVAANTAARRKRLKIKRVKGTTFTTVTVSGARPGTLRFRVRARTLSVPTKVTTQLTERR